MTRNDGRCAESARFPDVTSFAKDKKQATSSNRVETSRKDERPLSVPVDMSCRAHMRFVHDQGSDEVAEENLFVQEMVTQ